MIEPVLEDLISPAETDEEPPEALELALLLLLLHQAEDRLGESSDN